jgi:hypothetical protein
VFARDNGTPYEANAVTKRFRQLAIDAGVRPVRLRDLRHGAASLMLAGGMPLALVSKRLGHSSITITADTYTHMLEDANREAARVTEQLVPRALREQSVSAAANPMADLPHSDRVSADHESGPPGTRTQNQRIKSPLLCQLS